MTDNTEHLLVVWDIKQAIKLDLQKITSIYLIILFGRVPFFIEYKTGDIQRSDF